MNSPVLEYLKTDEFADSIRVVLPPVPMRHVLQRSPGVRRVGLALRFGQVAAADIREFVGAVLNEFQQGELFRYDIALCALAVAMEHWSNAIAEGFLKDLARIQRPEFPASSRVARECLKARHSFTATQVKKFRYPGGKVPVSLPSKMQAMRGIHHNDRKVVGCSGVRYSEVAHASA